MKRKLIVLVAAVLAVCCMAGLLSGCSVIVKNVEYIDLAGQGASAEYSFVDESLEAEQLYPVSKGGTMYFVSAEGDDANDGITPETPIKTLSKASSLSLKAGDSVLFRKGDTFVGNLYYANLEGTKENPITIASYGDGDERPVLTNGNETLKTEDVIRVNNSSGVVIRDLKLDVYTTSRVLRREGANGIAFTYNYVGDKKFSDIYIVNNILRAHDFSGEYIDEDTHAVGISITSCENTHEGQPVETLTDAYILNNDVSYFGRVGILVFGWVTENGGGNQCARNKFVNVHMDGNTVHHIGGLGMFISGGRNCTIDRNLVYQTGITTDTVAIEGECGIMYISSEYSSCRYNVVYDVYDAGTGCDAMGIDIDWNTDHITVEYNLCYDCEGGGIGTMANQNSLIAHNRIVNCEGATNLNGSIAVSNFTSLSDWIDEEMYSVTNCRIYDNLILHTNPNTSAFTCVISNGNRNYSGNEFVGNHVVLQAETDVSKYYWIKVPLSLSWYKFAENKYYSSSPQSSFRVVDKTGKNHLNWEDGAQVYRAGAGSPFSSWQKRDLGSTYEMRSNNAPSKVENVTCTYENGKLLLNISGDMSDVWHYNIYKVGFNESASYLNMIGQTESNTFEYDVPDTGEFFIIVQPESNQGIYGEGMKVKVTMKNNKAYADLAGKEASAVYAFTDKNLGEEQLYPVSKGGTVYYVSAEGDDANDGITPETPIKTLSKASSLSLKAGDSVLFRKGDTFVGNLRYSDLEGSKENPITIASYGDGDEIPVITNGNETLKNETVINFFNSSGVVIRDLKIDVYTTSRVLRTYSATGINLSYNHVGDKKFRDIYIVNNILRGHDFSGEYIDEDTNALGITVSSVESSHDGQPVETLTDAYILNNDVGCFGRVGMSVSGTVAGEGWWSNQKARNKFVGIHMDGNTIHHIGGLGMYISGGKNCTIDRNLVYQTGITTDKDAIEGECGIMYISSEYSSCRYNVIYDVFDAGTGHDSMGIDIDWNTDHITVEYNHCYNCQGDGIGTMANQNSIIAHNRIENAKGETNHAGSLVLDNFTDRSYPLTEDLFSITNCRIYDNLIIHTNPQVPFFRCISSNGNTDYFGNEFTDNHLVLKADTDVSKYYWIKVPLSLSWYKFAENKYYSSSPQSSFRVVDKTGKNHLNWEDGAQVYRAGAGSPFSSWQKRDLGSTYEMRSNNAPSKVENVTCTYENGKLLLNISGDMSDVWHYNIYKVGFNESASYLNMIGQTESNTFEYEVPHSGEFYIIVQPESNQGIYGEGFKIQISIG